MTEALSSASGEREKHPGGRPLKFGSVDELQKKIDAYFDACKEGRDLVTITGLALFLDTSRETLMNYEGREEFFDTVKKAKLRVECEYEKSLRVSGRTGDIFALKNFGWQDKTQTETKLSGGVIVVGSPKDKALLDAIAAKA